MRNVIKQKTKTKEYNGVSQRSEILAIHSLYYTKYQQAHQILRRIFPKGLQENLVMTGGKEILKDKIHCRSLFDCLKYQDI